VIILFYQIIREANMTIQPELTPQEKQKQQEAIQQLFDYTVAELNKGTARDVLAQKLVGMGLEQAEAGKYITAVEQQLKEIAQSEQMTGTEYLPGSIGGLLAAIVGGVLWGLITMATNKEYGIAAIGIGFLAGGGVLLFSGKKKGLPLQIIACVTSVLGILVGKYWIFMSQFKSIMAERYGAEAAKAIEYFSVETMQVFGTNIVSMLSGFDALWVLLAVITAWGMLKPVAGSKVTSGM
jgi:hypothetical protein